MTLSNVSLYNNRAFQGGGIYVIAGKLTLNSDIVGVVRNMGPANLGNKATSGGGIFIYGGTVSISAGSISNNAVSGVAAAGKPTGNGGGIYNYKGSLTITNNLSVWDNTATNQGGGMYLAIGSTTTFGNAACNLSGDAAGVAGPGVYQQVVGGNQANIVNWPGNVIDKPDPRGQYVPGP